MKNSYPIVLTPCGDAYTVYIPDFDIGTEGADLTEAIEMARDAIGLMGIDMEDDHKPLPKPSLPEKVEKSAGDIVTLVDVDFTEFRRKNDTRTIRHSCSIPSWLSYSAKNAGLDLSKVLENALMKELHLTGK